MKIGLVSLSVMYPKYTILIVPNNKKFDLEMFEESTTSTSCEKLDWTDYDNNFNYYLPDDGTNKMVFI